MFNKRWDCHIQVHMISRHESSQNVGQLVLAELRQRLMLRYSAARSSHRIKQCWVVHLLGTLIKNHAHTPSLPLHLFNLHSCSWKSNIIRYPQLYLPQRICPCEAALGYRALRTRGSSINSARHTCSSWAAPSPHICPSSIIILDTSLQERRVFAQERIVCFNF